MSDALMWVTLALSIVSITLSLYERCMRVKR